VALVFLLGGLSLISLGLLSILVGLAYAGQTGAGMAFGAGAALCFLGAGAIARFWRRARLGADLKKP
jgi:peptidoglycan/LPS O-acetylase OafA/YrhL